MTDNELLDQFIKEHYSGFEFDDYDKETIRDSFSFASYRADYYWQKMKMNRSDQFYKWMSDLKKEWKEFIHQIRR